MLTLRLLSQIQALIHRKALRGDTDAISIYTAVPLKPVFELVKLYPTVALTITRAPILPTTEGKLVQLLHLINTFRLSNIRKKESG